MKRVLVADGAEGGRELLRILLEHEGYEVLEASSGMEALAIARTMLPDLILLDLDLSGSDGLAAIQVMRLDEVLKDRAILAVTEAARRHERERLLKAGFSGCIVKPVVLGSLREQLSKLT
jgi:two-component system cell cycle response regulator DivK